MILSHTHKFIFFCSSKVGTTSMEEVLRPLQEGAEYDFGSLEAGIVPKHIPPAVLRGTLRERVWNEYFKFVFVRNPWDWFVSQWFYNSVGSVEERASAENQPTGLLGRLRRGFPPAEPLAAQSLIRPPGDGYRLRCEDVDTVFELLKRFKSLPGRDGLYQSNWVYDMDDRVIVDYVGRYETLDEDFAKILAQLDLDLELPHLNRTEHRDYRSYYTDEARDRVGELWGVDVRNFDYTFDPAPGGDGAAQSSRNQQGGVEVQSGQPGRTD